MRPTVPHHVILEVVRRALHEDLGGRGDITSQATLPAGLEAEYMLRARAGGRLAGSAAARCAFLEVEPELALTGWLDDGAELAPGTVVGRIRGPVRSILTAERVALNLLGRLAGIATLTRRFVDAVAGTGARITHTRKTTPGLRALELAAVAAGGGAMHRFGLDDAILIKDNHVAACGSVAEAVRRARDFAGHMTRVAVEIDRIDQLDEAIDAGAESVLLDNFDLEGLRAAVELAAGRVTLEASGNVTLETVRAIAETGVDVISIGALTHSAPNLDLGLDAD
ncbi:carboxylating nicotinate-nucleotide diphosphorylase [Wenzhouxiangella sp. XN79A]|uniref:carboxylating nicotinate-nucleotide diphosphorylase n=1 Tax=Wenzhouxiangella sp. XN79A TaxID=2724193 RepID=UPI00144AE68B|nr:carboxylating nicotinate-nucleotide diphosphorylase [Wenzhouxiangella sp. XN79A]NKI36393.1 carboxylating nicotinate-nucleotide diphosphorylase [Wenzhouxiangella sp. XN79A]